MATAAAARSVSVQLKEQKAKSASQRTIRCRVRTQRGRTAGPAADKGAAAAEGH
jgi:hypothetical protein